MTEIQTTVAFKSLTAQTCAVLLTQGMEVEPTAVQGVLAQVVTVTAERTGLDEEEALHLVAAEAVADLIAQAADERLDGAEGVHAVRPVRTPPPTATAGPPAHLMDLATELGAALGPDNGPTAPVGVLDELADHLDRTIARIDTGEWSICPCGEDHDQDDVDAGAARTMRHDATLARTLRRKVT